MALNVTLLQLRNQVRQRADMVYSTFVTNEEINTFINSAMTELYDKLVAASEDYFIKSASIVTDGVNDTFSLPSDFYKLNGVDCSLNGIDQTMEKFVFEDRHKYLYNTNLVRYRIIKNSIVFKPKPSAQTITIWYTPAVVLLSSDTDVFDGVNGWEDFIVCDATIKCLMKEESDVTILLAEKQGIEQRIDAMKKNRDQARPDRVTDVTGLRGSAFFLGDESWV
jgi:hypothetical protein